jgi:hypothetical protein
MAGMAGITITITMLRLVGSLVGALFIVLGLYALVHDALVLVHVAQPVGDGPFGIVGGPIFMLIGALIIWRLWPILRNSN